jgi:hypothetical protein
MLIFRGGSWPEHRPWFLATVAATLAASVWYGLASARAGFWLGGGSVPGLTFGVVGGLIVVFEMLLWVRKKFRAVRIGRATLWMKAHLWLGLLCLPLIVLHGGFHWPGGSLARVLMLTFLTVIVSGVWGLVLQQYLPRLMFENVPAETIRSQIDVVLAQLLRECERVVRMSCGLEEPQAVAADRERSFLVVGAVRESGALHGKYLRTESQVPRLRDPGPLLAFFEETVAPYLRAKTGSGSLLASAKRAGDLFRDTRSLLGPAADPVVEVLEDACNQRRQFDLQARLHGWLHGWLCVHIPVSLMMFILMLAHVYYALRYR